MEGYKKVSNEPEAHKVGLGSYVDADRELGVEGVHCRRNVVEPVRDDL